MPLRAGGEAQGRADQAHYPRRDAPEWCPVTGIFIGGRGLRSREGGFRRRGEWRNTENQNYVFSRFATPRFLQNWTSFGPRFIDELDFGFIDIGFTITGGFIDVDILCL